MMKILAVLIGLLIIAYIYVFRPAPDIQELLHAHGVNYYTDSVVTACGTEKEEVGAFTCGKKIYVAEPWFSNLPVGVRVFVMAHEQGHQADPVENDVLTDEQYADCYAGMKLGTLDEIDKIDQQDIADVHKQLSQWGSEDHGTSDVRWGAVMYGYVEQNCGMYNIV